MDPLVLLDPSLSFAEWERHGLLLKWLSGFRILLLDSWRRSNHRENSPRPLFFPCGSAQPHQASISQASGAVQRQELSSRKWMQLLLFDFEKILSLSRLFLFIIKSFDSFSGYYNSRSKKCWTYIAIITWHALQTFVSDEMACYLAQHIWAVIWDPVIPLQDAPAESNKIACFYI